MSVSKFKFAGKFRKSGSSIIHTIDKSIVRAYNIEEEQSTVQFVEENETGKWRIIIEPTQ